MITTKKQQYSPAEERWVPPKLPPPEERFWELYKCALTGVHAQFEQIIYEGEIGRSFVFYEDKDFVMRSKHFARVAYNSATEACKLVAEQDALANFNKKA